MTVKMTVACLGAGYFSTFHRDAWQRMEQAELVGVCDADPARAAATGVAAYSDLRQMLEDLTPDLLDIITPPSTHADAIRTAVACGVKTMICQKPFCSSLEDARETVAFAEQANVTVIVHENFRFQPWYRRMKAAIDEGRLGQVLQATFRMRTGDGQGPDAYLSRQPYFQTMPRLLIHETGVHWVDTFRYLFGDPVSVYADLRRCNPVIKGEDAGHVLFGYKSGMTALYDGNRLLDHDCENPRLTFGEALVEGTEGSLTLDGAGKVQFRGFGSRESEVLLEPRQWPGFAGDCVFALQSHVVSMLVDGLPVENIARDYLAVRETEQAIYNSAEAGRREALGNAVS